MQRPSPPVFAATILASGATLLLAVAPALGPAISAQRDGPPVVELPRVVINGTREARAPGTVELPRGVVEARRPARVAAVPGSLKPAMQRSGT